MRLSLKERPKIKDESVHTDVTVYSAFILREQVVHLVHWKIHRHKAGFQTETNLL